MFHLCFANQILTARRQGYLRTRVTKNPVSKKSHSVSFRDMIYYLGRKKRQSPDGFMILTSEETDVLVTQFDEEVGGYNDFYFFLNLYTSLILFHQGLKAKPVTDAIYLLCRTYHIKRV